MSRFLSILVALLAFAGTAQAQIVIGGANGGSSAPINVIIPDSATTTGTITSNQSVTFTNPGGMGTFAYDVAGTWTGLIVIEAQATSTGGWYPTTMVPFNGTAVGSVTANSGGQGAIGGVYAIRFRGNTVTSGTATVTIRAGNPANAVMQVNLHWSSNLDQINGVTVLVGAGATGTGAQRTTVAQDSTTIAGLAPGPVAPGTAQSGSHLTACVYNSTPPGPTNGQQVATQCDSAGNALVDIKTALPAGTNAIGKVDPNTAANWGLGSTGSAVPATGHYVAGNAQSTEPAKATTGSLFGAFFDLVGKSVTSPYSPRELMLRGSASSTSNTAVTLISAQGVGVKTYITDVECGRTDAGTTAIYVTLSDTASTILVLPNSGGGGGNSKTFNVPLATPANTAFQFISSASTSTVYCSVQGFAGY